MNDQEKTDRDPSASERNYVDLAYPLRIATGILLATIVVLTILQVFFRFVIGSPLIWSEEMARICLVWMTFVGAAVVCWDGTHLNVDVTFSLLPKRVRKLVRDFNIAVALIFLGCVIYFGWPLVEFAHRQIIGTLNLPLSVIRVSGVVGSALMIVFIILRRFYRLPREAGRTRDDTTSFDAM